jgi:hypothetical protein
MLAAAAIVLGAVPVKLRGSVKHAVDLRRQRHRSRKVTHFYTAHNMYLNLNGMDRCLVNAGNAQRLWKGHPMSVQSSPKNTQHFSSLRGPREAPGCSLVPDAARRSGERTADRSSTAREPQLCVLEATAHPNTCL